MLPPSKVSLQRNHTGSLNANWESLASVQSGIKKGILFNIDGALQCGADSGSLKGKVAWETRARLLLIKA